MISFKQYLIEKKHYTPIQHLCISLWGSVLYLDYDILPVGKGNIKQLKIDAKEYIDSAPNSEDREDLDEWFSEGASRAGVPSLTKRLYNDIMTSAQEETTKNIVLYKSGEKSTGVSRWLSMTLKQGAYSNLGPESRYEIKSGTPVVWTQGLADKAEVIIHSNYLHENNLVK